MTLMKKKLILLSLILIVLVGAIALMPEKKVYKASASIKKLAGSLVILSVAMKIMGSMSWGEVARGIVGAAGGLGVLIGALYLIPKDAKIRSLSLMGLATAMVIMGSAMKIMGSMSWGELAKGLTGVGVLMAEVSMFLALTKNNKKVITGVVLPPIWVALEPMMMKK